MIRAIFYLVNIFIVKLSASKFSLSSRKYINFLEKKFFCKRLQSTRLVNLCESI